VKVPQWKAIAGAQAKAASTAELGACTCVIVAAGDMRELVWHPAVECCLLHVLEKAHWRSIEAEFWRLE
jgi:hypothetical protein